MTWAAKCWHCIRLSATNDTNRNTRACPCLPPKKKNVGRMVLVLWRAVRCGRETRPTTRLQLRHFFCQTTANKFISPSPLRLLPLSIATVRLRLLAVHERMKNRGPDWDVKSNSSSFLEFFPFFFIFLPSPSYLLSRAELGHTKDEEKQIYEISLLCSAGFCHQTHTNRDVYTYSERKRSLATANGSLQARKAFSCITIYFSTCTTTPHRHSQSTTFECYRIPCPFISPHDLFPPRAALYIVTSRR